jgi:protein TonB
VKFKSGGKDFGLWPALAASLALHAALPWQALPRPAAASRAVQPLAATLPRLDLAPVEPAATSLPADVRPVAGAAALDHSPAPPEPSKPPNPPKPSNTAPSAVPALPPASDPMESGGPDAEGLRLYRLNLAVAARRFKRYPVPAMDRGLSGRAEVAVAVAADGIAQPPQLASSSGHELLDEAALDMIARAVQATSLPQKLRGQAFAVRLPVLFAIEEE